MSLDLVLLLLASLLGICFQRIQLSKYLHDIAKLVIYSTLLINIPQMLIGLIGYIWLREFLKQKDNEQQQNIKQIPEIKIQSSKEGQTAASLEVPHPVETVQIFDYITGESEYALIQKADKSYLTQLGVTLKNTILLEKGRVHDGTSNQVSKLISQIDDRKRINAQNISLKYESAQEYLKNQNRPHFSIPFKIGEFDKQMGEIVEEVILSDRQGKAEQIQIIKKIDYENSLIAILLIGIIPLVQYELKIINSIIFGLVIHCAFQRDEIITDSYIIMILLTILGCCGMYILGIYINFSILILGSLTQMFQKINPNLIMLILPIMPIITYLL